jgi:hypothetical protein
MIAADSVTGEAASTVGEAATLVAVAVDEGVAVGCAVAVAVDVDISVGVGVAVRVLAASLVGIRVAVGDADGVRVDDGVGDAVSVAGIVAVADGDGVFDASTCVPKNGEGLATAGEAADVADGMRLSARAVGDAGGSAVGLVGSSRVAVDTMTGAGSPGTGGDATAVADWARPLIAPGEATGEPAN